MDYQGRLLAFIMPFVFALILVLAVGTTNKTIAACDGPPCCSPQATCWHNCDCKQAQNGDCPASSFPCVIKRLNNYWIPWDQCKWCFSDRDAWRDVRTPPTDWYQHHKTAESDWNAAGSNMALFEVSGVSSAQIGSSMWDWCRWTRRMAGSAAGTVSPANTEYIDEKPCPCGMPTNWRCYSKVRIRFNGWVRWTQSSCDVSFIGNITDTPVPSSCEEDQPDGSTTVFPQPTFSFEMGGQYTTIHEFGHAIGLNHPPSAILGAVSCVNVPANFTCEPVDTIMRPSHKLSCSGNCGNVHPTASDRTAVRFLYGP